MFTFNDALDQDSDSYYLPAGLIGEDTPPRTRKSSAPVQGQLDHSVPPGINSFQRNRSSWSDCFGSTQVQKNPSSFVNQSEWQSPWSTSNNMQSSFQMHNNVQSPGTFRTPSRPQDNENSRGRDAYNAHFFNSSSSSMSYGGFRTSSSEDFDNSSNSYYSGSYPSSQLIPSSFSLHNQTISPGNNYPSVQNSFQIPAANQFGNNQSFYSTSPSNKPSQPPRSHLTQSAPSVETDQPIERKPLQPFFPPGVSVTPTTKMRTKRRKPGKKERALERRRKAALAAQGIWNGNGSSDSISNDESLSKSGDGNSNTKARDQKPSNVSRRQRCAENRCFSIPVDVEPLLLARKHGRLQEQIEKQKGEKNVAEGDSGSVIPALIPSSNDSDLEFNSDSGEQSCESDSESVAIVVPHGSECDLGSCVVSDEEKTEVTDHQFYQSEGKQESKDDKEKEKTNSQPHPPSHALESVSDDVKEQNVNEETEIGNILSNDESNKEESSELEKNNEEKESSDSVTIVKSQSGETKENCSELPDEQVQRELDLSNGSITEEVKSTRKAEILDDTVGTITDTDASYAIYAPATSPSVISKVWENVSEGICGFFAILLSFLFKLHHSALSMLIKNDVAFTITYIYAFPFIVSSLTDHTTSAASIIWYSFLVWFFVSHHEPNPSGNPPSLNIALLLPLLFVFEGVCNPKFIVMWNGGERLVLAFVLLSMKSKSFLDWSCFVSLALLIVASVVLGANILVQWAILVMALYSLSPSFSFDPLMQGNNDIDETIGSSSYQDCSKEDRYNPSFEANVLPPATCTVGFYSKEESTKVSSRLTKRNKRKR